MVAAVLATPVPFKVAPLVVTAVAARVVTDGGPGVVKTSSAPLEVPAALEASAQK